MLSVSNLLQFLGLRTIFVMGGGVAYAAGARSRRYLFDSAKLLAERIREQKFLIAPKPPHSLS
jgi:hypothetical protein